MGFDAINDQQLTTALLDNTNTISVHEQMLMMAKAHSTATVVDSIELALAELRRNQKAMTRELNKRMRKQKETP